MAQRLTRRWHWKELFAICIIFLISTVLISFIFPLFYVLFLSEPWLIASSSFASSFVVVTVLGALFKRAINMDFTETYPEGIEVFNLDQVSEFFAYSRLKVASYPKSKYIPNPALTLAEKILTTEPLASLQQRLVYITGSPGTGKSTAAVQIMAICQKKLTKSLLQRPKLILVTGTFVGNLGLRFPRFSESIVVMVDDYQFLNTENQIAVRKLIDQFARNEREGLVVCVSREHPRHILPYNVPPIHIDCDVKANNEYLQFIESLIKQEAKQAEVSITPDVELALAKKIIALREPPLYLVFLLAENKGSKLTLADLDVIPEGIAVLCMKSWEELNPSQKDLVRTISILKRIQSPLIHHNISIIYTCVFDRKDYSDIYSAMDGSIWFFTSHNSLIAPDSPYEFIDYVDINRHIKNLGDILLDNYYDKEKVECIRQIQNHILLLALIGVYHRTSPMYAAECFKKVLEVSLNENQIGLANQARYVYAQMLMELGRFQESANEFRLVVKETPDYMGAWSNLGVALASLEKFKEAERAFKRALELEPDSVAVFTNLGHLYQNIDLYQKANEFYRKAIDLEPENSMSLYNLGILKIKEEKYDEGCMLFQKARETAIESLKELPDSYNSIIMNYLQRIESAILKYCGKEEKSRE